MAVTVTSLPGGVRAKRWSVVWALTTDTVATIPHGFPVIPDHVEFYALNVQANEGLVFKGTPDLTNIYLTKTTDLNTAGASVEVIAYIPGSSL
jgi:hypothetical protein